MKSAINGVFLLHYPESSRGEMDITAVFGTAIPGSNPGGSIVFLAIQCLVWKNWI